MNSKKRDTEFLMFKYRDGYLVEFLNSDIRNEVLLHYHLCRCILLEVWLQCTPPKSLAVILKSYCMVVAVVKLVMRTKLLRSIMYSL